MLYTIKNVSKYFMNVNEVYKIKHFSKDYNNIYY